MSHIAAGARRAGFQAMGLGATAPDRIPATIGNGRANHTGAAFFSGRKHAMDGAGSSIIAGAGSPCGIKQQRTAFC